MIALEAVRLLGIEAPELDASLDPFADLWVPWGDRPSRARDNLPSLIAAGSNPRCVVGIIDHAIPFAHPRLRATDGTSRVASAWVMEAPPMADGVGDVDFGRTLTGREITRLIETMPSEDAVYRAVGAIAPGRASRVSLAHAATHGAAVADLAVGGLDAGAPVICVSLPDAVVRQTQGVLMPSYLVLATLFILERAARLSRAVGERLPVVINASLGVSGGPKDGTGLFERLVDALADHSLPVGPVTVCLPMGNHALSAASGSLAPGPSEIGWAIPPDDRSPSFLELHSGAGALGQIWLAPPGGTELRLPDLAPGRHIDLARGDHHLARAYRSTRDVWTVALPPTDRFIGPARGCPGLWRVGRLGGTDDIEVHLLRDDPLLKSGARPAKLVDIGKGGRITPARSVNAFATARHAVRVGAKAAYSGRDARHPRSETGDAVLDVDPSRVAPGMNASGTLGGSVARISGTSAASALAARERVEALSATPQE